MFLQGKLQLLLEVIFFRLIKVFVVVIHSNGVSCYTPKGLACSQAA